MLSVGDKVIHEFWGRGVVERITQHHKAKYPVKVRFGAIIRGFTADGLLCRDPKQKSGIVLDTSARAEDSISYNPAGAAKYCEQAILHLIANRVGVLRGPTGESQYDKSVARYAEALIALREAASTVQIIEGR